MVCTRRGPTWRIGVVALPPGLVTLVGRRGEVHADAVGMKAVGGRDTIRRDAIFRIYSMTQPITAATYRSQRWQNASRSPCSR
ncbi:MAG: serine hydrolase [Candidatus Lambdaproteobacteria bacterium]|nr:serine hydrolase [Candidatus Lambdaproteobacteria bacterium]